MPIDTACANRNHASEKRWGRRYPITKRRDKRGHKHDLFGRPTGTDELTRQEAREAGQGIGNYSRGCRNSNPNRRISPRLSTRRTLATIGGVSLGRRLEEAGEGAGMVRWTVCSGRRRWTDVIQAPVVLMLRVLVSSMNSAPEASEARRNTGT